MLSRNFASYIAPLVAGWLTSRSAASGSGGLLGSGGMGSTYPAPRMGAGMGPTGMMSGAATAYAANALTRRLTRNRSPLLAAGLSVVAPMVVAQLASRFFGRGSSRAPSNPINR